MHVHDFSKNNSILNQFLHELRSTSIQQDRLRFRKNIERIGEILSYEMSKSLPFQNQTTQTPLGQKDIALPEKDIVICSILRAGVPLHQGVMNYFDGADSAFISAYRHHKHNSSDFEIVVEYVACPSLENKTLVLVDPMLATGQSLALTYEALLRYGKPKNVHLISVIGAKDGVDFVSTKFDSDTHLWIAAIDDTLNDKGYIVPGLGDAGDLAFGSKLQQ
jgi:uracil phosphoribosyltransferase